MLACDDFPGRDDRPVRRLVPERRHLPDTPRAVRLAPRGPSAPPATANCRGGRTCPWRRGSALRGRCRTCQLPISIRYPLVELATGAAFALTTWAWHGTIIAAAYCVLAASIIAVGLIEYGGQRAPLSVAAVAGTGLALTIIVVGGGLAASVEHRRRSPWSAHWRALPSAPARQPGSRRAAMPERYGRSGLVLVGCWSGGLGLAATTVGLALGWSPTSPAWSASRATARSAVTGGAPMAPARRLHPVLETPLVTAIAVAMVASLVVGA